MVIPIIYIYFLSYSPVVSPLASFIDLYHFTLSYFSKFRQFQFNQMGKDV